MTNKKQETRDSYLETESSLAVWRCKPTEQSEQ